MNGFICWLGACSSGGQHTFSTINNPTPGGPRMVCTKCGSTG